ncbi:MAG: putative small secreted protein [Glaciecola sp.]|jgi:predicted small secreted protein
MRLRHTSPPRQRPRTQRTLTLLAVSAMLLSACGSTVRVVGPDLTEREAIALGAVTGGDGAGASSNGSGTVDADSSAGAGTTAGSAGSSSTGTAASPGGTAGTTEPTDTTDTTGSTDSTGSAGPSGTTGATGSTGSGATTESGSTGPVANSDTTPVKVGAIILKNGDKIMASMGTTVSFGDGRLEVTAVVDHVNRNGGIGGRPIDLYIAEVDVAAADSETDYNNACLKLTEDDDVFVVMTVINPPESFIACVGNHKKLLLNASFSPGDDKLFNEYHDWSFSPTLLSLDRGVRLMLDVAKAEGRLDGVKVGVVYYDGDPQPIRVVEGTVVPKLDAWGVDYVTAGINDAGQVGPVQVQFAGANVELVMFVTPNGIAQIVFMNAAENQLYRPKYFTTDPDSTRFVSETAPEEQAKNIAGVGTLPIANVPVQSYPTTPAEEACLQVIREAGESGTDRLSNVTATLYCELVYEFEFVAEQVSGPLNYDDWRSAYRASGSSYPAISTFGVNFSGGRNDGATLYRHYAWSDDCSCLAYTSPTIPVPAG